MISYRDAFIKATSIKQVDQYLIDNDIDVGDIVVINNEGFLEKVGWIK